MQMHRSQSGVWLERVSAAHSVRSSCDTNSIVSALTPLILIPFGRSTVSVGAADLDSPADIATLTKLDVASSG